MLFLGLGKSEIFRAEDRMEQWRDEGGTLLVQILQEEPAGASIVVPADCRPSEKAAVKWS